MKVRAIDSLGDWQFGKGKNDYISGVAATRQDIETRLYEFVGDCFFNNTAGIDWFNLLGGKDQTALNLAISTCILNTADVTGIVQLDVALNSVRNFRVTYEVQTSYGTAAGTFIFDPENI